MWDFHEALEYYKRQGAAESQIELKSLLSEIAKEYSGVIPACYVEKISESYKMRESFLLAVIRNMPSVRIENTDCLEICMGSRCTESQNLILFAHKIKDDRKVNLIIKSTQCMHMCGKGPNIKFNGKIYNNADEELIKNLLNSN